jgi:hypothetical protein
MVLGVDWLRRYFLVFLFYFIKMKISFEKERKNIELKGIMKQAKLHMTATKVYKNLKEVIFVFVGQLFVITISEELDSHIDNKKINALLKEFQSVFEEPK